MLQAPKSLLWQLVNNLAISSAHRFKEWTSLPHQPWCICIDPLEDGFTYSEVGKRRGRHFKAHANVETSSEAPSSFTRPKVGKMPQ